MLSIAIRRLRVLPIGRGTGLSTKRKVGILTEISRLGYAVRNPDLLDEASDVWLLNHRTAMETLASMRGGDVTYVPLFLDFPTSIPDDDTYFAKRVMGYLGNALGLFTKGTRLENGMVIPDWLFDISRFGADPITQLQTASQHDAAVRTQAAHPPDTHVEWTDLEWVHDDAVMPLLQGFLHDNLYAGASIKEALHADLRELLAHFGVQGIDFEQVTQKENRALVLSSFWQSDDLDSVVSLADTPTDVLRLFAALTQTDVSLSSKVQFPKMRRAQRRAVLQILESSASLAEDLHRYRGLWLKVGRSLHVTEHRSRFPKTAAAFDALRNGRIDTFNGRTEYLIAGLQLDDLLIHLSTRPGVLGRKLHELLRRFPSETDRILVAFAEVAARMTLKNTLVLQSYMATINHQTHRTVINKRGKIRVLPNNSHNALTDEQIVHVQAVLQSALDTQMGARASWSTKTAWIDPSLAQYTVPLQQRAASDGLISYGRGSRIPVDFDRVLRLFVYWKQSARCTDLDLTVLQLDADHKYAGHVSYTNLKSSGILHSGDLQSAPHGAAEFVDITLDALPANVKYLAIQVYRYAGEAFADIQCHAGWMLRDQVDASVKSFDIQTVAHKFDLSGNAAYCVPVVVDLERREMVLTDLYMGSRTFHNNVEGAHSEVALACREVMEFTRTRPTMWALAKQHVAARGATLVDQTEADLTFGLRDCTFNAEDVEQVLSELL